MPPKIWRVMPGLMPAGARLVLVGDVDQLPSVGPGAVLGDVIACHAVDVVRLSQIFRQAEQSLIVVNAHPAVVDVMNGLRGSTACLEPPSPRATLSWVRLAMATALLAGRDHVLPEDLTDTAAFALATNCSM